MKKSRVYLRALDVSDLERTYRWHNDYKMYESMGGNFRYVSRSAEEDWLNKRVEFSNTELTLAICLTETDEHIGNVFVRNIDWINRTATGQGAFIDPNHQSRGYHKEALLLFWHHIFKDLGLNRLESLTLTDNEAVIRGLEKLNAKLEGRLRQACLKNGEFVDLFLFSILASDYDELMDRLAREEAEKQEGKQA